MSKNGKTISLHNGSTYSRGHNIRDERFIKNMENIDSSLTENNIVYRDIPVRQAYEDIFKNAVEEYNAKQKRADRCIDDYYKKIKDDKRKHTVYECIVQIGDRDDTGNSAEKEKQALLDYVKEWDSRNPNLKLIGAYIHADEPEGTVHLHCDYIPVAHCTRGMSLQNSLDRALQEQGLHSDSIKVTAQIAWQDKERDALKEICNKHEIDIDDEKVPLSAEHVNTPTYKRMKDQMRKQAMKELEPEIAEIKKYIELDVTTEDVSERFTVKKTLFKEEQIVGSVADFEILKEQARAYRINRDRIESVVEREKRINEIESKYALADKNFDRQARRIIGKAHSRADELTKELRKKISNVEKKEQELKEKELSIKERIEEGIKKEKFSLEYMTQKHIENQIREDKFYKERREELDREKEYYEAEKRALASRSLLYEETEMKNKALEKENEELKQENIKLQGIIERMKKRIEKWAFGFCNILNTVRKAYLFKDTPKEQRMLYESTLDYGVNVISNDGLTDTTQEKLAAVAMQNESPQEIAKILDDKIKEEYKKQHPQQTRSHGRGGR